MEKKTKDKGVEPSQKMRQSPTMDAVNTNGSEVVTQIVTTSNWSL